MIAQGKYLAMPMAWGLIESKSDNNPEQYAIDFEIQNEGDHAGESITWFGTFSDAAFEYTMQKIRACGLVGDDLRTLKRDTDKPVRISVKHEEYQGQTRARVAFIDSGSAVSTRALPPDRAAAFAERMRQRIRGFDAKAGSPSPRSAGTRPAPGNARGGSMGDPIGERPPGEDDIPF